MARIKTNLLCVIFNASWGKLRRLLMTEVIDFT
jgi:hypothetical protein